MVHSLELNVKIFITIIVGYVLLCSITLDVYKYLYSSTHNMETGHAFGDENTLFCHHGAFFMCGLIPLKWILLGLFIFAIFVWLIYWLIVYIILYYT